MPGNWTGVAEAYRRSFAGVCAGTLTTLLDAAESAGRRLLDVGSGTGSFARQAADRGLEVTAVDADRDMLALTAVALDDRGTVVAGRLPALPLADGEFDVVTANFVINHVPKPRAGMAELARVVRPGGAVLITTWTNQPTAQARLFQQALDEAGAIRPDGIRLQPEDDFERSVAGLADLACAAGLQVEERRELRWDWTIGWDELWHGVSAGIAAIGQTYVAQPPAVQDRLRRSLRAHASGLMRDGAIVLPSVAVYVKAIKPSGGPASPVT